MEGIRRRRLLLAGLAAIALLAGCGSDVTTGGGATGRSPSSSETSVPADNGSGEGSPIRFVSTRNHYRVDFASVMTEAPDGTATATRGTETLVIRVVQGAAGGDLAGFAATDLQSVRSQARAYAEVTPMGTTSLGGRSVQKVVYTSAGSVNPVTGNPEMLVNARYYIPRGTAAVAVLTYSITDNQYDPQGADDVAMTFQWQ